jgi:hypothetical protein
MLGLDPQREVFAHGQLYSAMTRVSDSENVLILKNEDDLSTATVNIVWEELLLHYFENYNEQQILDCH